ncbi:MAG: recombinase XerC [Betaproteobacteria bacterium HGW-Betaproteobacteria-22]|nr:MAG: recombinase XerC [Betaproteobacteria bacterium HGW-Betaproteobacteria-22]
MLKHNPDNERIKHKYFTFLKDAMRVSEHTIDGVAKAIARFEAYTKYKDFKTFKHEQATGFKKYLIEQKSQCKDTKLSKSTIHSTFAHLKRFFEWLAREQGYKSRIQFSDAEYFNTSSKDLKIATARRIQKVPTLEQIMHVIANMPTNTEIERRNRALVAFTLLTGARDSAIASAKLKHINLEENSFFQDARDVNTKFSKTFTTFFFPVGDDIKQIVVDWIQYLKVEKLYGNNDPLFPMNEIGLNEQLQFSVIGIKPEHWSTASPIREIFKQAFNQAGLEYFNPHSFRNTLVQFAHSRCKSPEELKAWSQNLGHESVMTTLMSYGQVAIDRQSEIISNLSEKHSEIPAHAVELAKAIVREMQAGNFVSPTATVV